MVTHRDRLAAALQLIERGVNVIPVGSDKKPVVRWASFQEAHATPDNLRAWFGNGHDHNIGIVTGRISGLVVVDADGEDGERWAQEHLPETPLMVRTAKGLHRYYKHPGVPVRNRVRLNTGDERIAVDIHGDHGSVLAPGSRHPSGATYQLIGRWPASLDELPRFDPAWIAPSPTLEASARGSCHESKGAPPDRDTLIRRARAYLEKTPPAIEGQGGDVHTFTVACRIVRGFGLDDADALEVLNEWNQTCLPSWSDDELRDKIDSARKYGKEPIGGRIDDVELVVRAQQTPEPLPREEEVLTDVSSTFTSTHTLDRLTEAGAAERFVRLHGSAIRFDHRRNRWLVWRSHRWVPDADAAVTRLALDFARSWQREAIDLPDPDRRAAVVKFAIQLERRNTMHNVLALAKALKPVADSGEAWDADPYLLGVSNGVVELRTGLLRPGDPADRITMQTAASFDPSARCPRWERFVSEIVGGDAEMVPFLQRAIGYSLTGITTEQVLFVLYGTGANGKGSLTNTLNRVLADYGWNMPFATIEMQNRSGIPNDLAALMNRRFVSASETNDGARLNEARVKALTGCDPITARFLHGEFFTFEPVGKFWLSVNHKPIVRDDSFGFWRRLRLIPLTQRFDVDPTLADVLQGEASGILNWCLAGCLTWQRDGLRPPDLVLTATREYAEDSDPLAASLDEACEHDPNAAAGARELFEHYKTWAEKHGLGDRERMSATMFGRKMSERLTWTKGRRGKTYSGLSLRNV